MLVRLFGPGVFRMAIVAAGLLTGITGLLVELPRAQAAEPAQLVVLGFSSNGRYFAFAETAALGESGRAGGQVTLIDVARDRLLTGAYPALKVRDAADAGAAMMRLERQSRAALGRFGLQWPAGGREAAPTGTVRDLEGDRFSLERVIQGERFTVSGASPVMPAAGGCPVPVRGLELTVTRNEREVLRQRDTTLPSSRGCPVAYGVRDILTRRLGDGRTALAVLVAYDKLSGGGLARSHIAITRLIAR